MTGMEAFGQRLRMLCKRKIWMAGKLSSYCALSVNFLSQVERGVSSLSISSLYAICKALEVPVTCFTSSTGNSPILRAGQPCSRIHFQDSQVTYNLPSGPMPGRVLDALIAEFTPHYAHLLITHEGEEFGYVLKGELILQVENNEFALMLGDSFHIFSSQRYTIHNNMEQVGKTLWVLPVKLLEGGDSVVRSKSTSVENAVLNKAG